MEFQRLKDKLGTRSLPSSEVEFRGAARAADRRGGARRAGDHPDGQPHPARLPARVRPRACGAARVEAIHHARHRSAFGALLVDQPAMRNVLADLAHRVRGGDRRGDARRAQLRRAGDEAGFRRFATAVMKYWVCKRAAAHAAEALECLGGNGFVEDSGMPLLYRDAPLDSIWEGSGNVAALDVLRAIVKEPDGLPAFMAECELAAGGGRRLDAHLERAAASAPRLPSRARIPSSRRGGSSRSWRSRSGVAARPARAAGGRRRVLRGAARRRGRPRVRHAPGGRRRGRDHRSRAAGMSGRPLRGRPTGRAADAQPARARQRDHARPDHRARAVRRAGRPRPGGPRAAAVGQRQGVLRRLRPGRERRGAGRVSARPRPTRRPARRSTRW